MVSRGTWVTRILRLRSLKNLRGFSPESVNKLNDADAATRAVQAIVSSGESLQQNPGRGAIVEEVVGLRKIIVPFGKYGYIIHYAILEDDVIILRVYHGRENRPV